MKVWVSVGVDWLVCAWWCELIAWVNLCTYLRGAECYLLTEMRTHGCTSSPYKGH